MKPTYECWVKYRFQVASLEPCSQISELGADSLEHDFATVSQLIQAVAQEPLQQGAGEDVAAALTRVLGAAGIFVKNGNTAEVWRDSANYKTLLEALLASLINKYEAGAPLTPEQTAMAAHVREAASKDTVKSENRTPSIAGTRIPLTLCRLPTASLG